MHYTHKVTLISFYATNFFLRLHGKSYYQVIMPVYVENQKAGSLIMLHDMTHTEKLIQTITRIEVLALAFLFILVFIIITSN